MNELTDEQCKLLTERIRKEQDLNSYSKDCINTGSVVLGKYAEAYNRYYNGERNELVIKEYEYWSDQLSKEYERKYKSNS